MQKVQPFLWFDNQAEEAANFYVSLFRNSKVLGTTHYSEGAPQPAGSVMTVSFELEGTQFIALNGGPHFHFTEAISLFISAETQEEIDGLWEKLCSGGGSPGRCGWLKDKYGLSWQVAPPILPKLLSDPDRAKAGRVMQTMLGMSKIVIADLQAAYDAE
jgi:predicted 3-demethylubiquinone-9 3-methyltransferase (glyoxalase superfamily)